ncbi:hypothetical protein B0T25DRAFT_550622 [Lasiosphaeria hispida]|uniref:Uncharacterized protein n=1 Tax=Lasiosphaeria hispida TaxID=260671 RepID=A0AAJ0HB10_9PEZI|nr:hypothetical protein B0T25DRAFT_550622 [Lasiosphaeria hispida]
MGKTTRWFRTWIGQLQPQRQKSIHSVPAQTKTAADTVSGDPPPPYTESSTAPSDSLCPDTGGEYATVDATTIINITTAISTTALNLPTDKVSAAALFVASGIIYVADMVANVPVADAATVADIMKTAVKHIANAITAMPDRSSDILYDHYHTMAVPGFLSGVINAVGYGSTLSRESKEILLQYYAPVKTDIGLALLATQASSTPAVAAAVMTAVDSVADGISKAAAEDRKAVANAYSSCARRISQAVTNSAVAAISQGVARPFN